MTRMEDINGESSLKDRNFITNDDVIVSIVNHNLNQNAIELKLGFKNFCETILIDSGSNITPDEKIQFDYLLPNVYYSGLMNKAFEHFKTKKRKFYSSSLQM